jgi:hypothetical protein
LTQAETVTVTDDETPAAEAADLPQAETVTVTGDETPAAEAADLPQTETEDNKQEPDVQEELTGEVEEENA